MSSLRWSPTYSTLSPATGCICLALLAAGLQADETPLDRYVATPDSHYRYEVLQTHKGDGFTVLMVKLVSQAWLTTNEVDRPIWEHSLTIIRPESARYQTGLLFIAGGSNNKPMPTKPDDQMVKVAMATSSVVAQLRMVPNQPLEFRGDGVERFEDDLIAYTWDKYLRTGDSKWPARLPMTKSAVRAMDTVTALTEQHWGKPGRVESFVVAGGSKRGWTTWTTAIVDPRVKAIVPIVIDMLNVQPSFRHHWEAYGFYAPAVGDYVSHGIMEWQGTPEYAALMEIVEPYEYRDRLTMPKLILNATGDQFFLPDSSQFYWKDLPGKNYLRYVPNADHSLDDTDALETLVGFYGAVLRKEALPSVTWSVGEEGSLQARCSETPKEVRQWQATNPDARDFRLEILGPAWKSQPVTADGDGLYLGGVALPKNGWTAYLLEFTFMKPGWPAPFKCTTEVVVRPEKLPFTFNNPQN